MKIYINNLNIELLNEFHNLLKKYIISSDTFITSYSDEGIYLVEDKGLYLLEPIDGEIKIYKKYYKEIDIIIDKSYFNKIKTYSINGSNINYTKINKISYKLPRHTKITIVAEKVTYNTDEPDIPKDFYFEVNGDINETFNEEIFEILDLLI